MADEYHGTPSGQQVIAHLDASETLSEDEQAWLQTIITPAVFQQMAPQDLYWTYRVLTLGHGNLEAVQSLQKEAGDIEEKPRIFISKMETRNPEEGRTIYLRLHKSIIGASGSERKIFRFKGVRPRISAGKIENYPADGIGGDGIGPVIRDGNILTEGRRDEGSLTRKKGTLADNRVQHEYEVMTGAASGGYLTDDPVGRGERNIGDQGDKMVFAIAAMDGEGDIRLWINDSTERLELYDFEKSDMEGEKIAIDEEASRQIYKEIGKTVRSFHQAGYVHQVLSFTNIGIHATGRNDDPYRAVLRDLDIALRSSEDPNHAANQRLIDLWRILNDLTAHMRNSDMLKKAFLDGYFDKEKSDLDYNSLEEEVLSRNYYKCAYYFYAEIIDWMELGTAGTTRFNILKKSYLDILQSMGDVSVRNFNKPKEELYEIRDEPNPLRWTVHFLRVAENHDALVRKKIVPSTGKGQPENSGRQRKQPKLRSEVRKSTTVALSQTNISTPITPEVRTIGRISPVPTAKPWQILRLKQDVIVVVEQARIDTLSPEMFKEILLIAGLNLGKLHLVIPDALHGKYSPRVAELRKVATVHHGFPQIAASGKVPVVGFSDMENDTLAAFQGRLDSRLAGRMRDSAFGLNQHGAFGIGILYALKDISRSELGQKNGYFYDAIGHWSALVLETLQAYTVISTSA